jgi:hypothetical protein
MSQIIEVTVSPQGETRIETKGFAGGTCRDASKVLEAALGVRETEQLTSEFHAVSSTENQQSLSQ